MVMTGGWFPSRGFLKWGTRNSSILMGFSTKKTLRKSIQIPSRYWGTPIYGNPHIRCINTIYKNPNISGVEFQSFFAAGHFPGSGIGVCMPT